MENTKKTQRRKPPKAKLPRTSDPNGRYRVGLVLTVSGSDGLEAGWGDQSYTLSLSPQRAGLLNVGIGLLVKKARDQQRADDRINKRRPDLRRSRTA